MRTVPGQLEAAALESQVLGRPLLCGVDPVAVDLQPDHGRGRIDRAQLCAQCGCRDGHSAEPEVDDEQAKLAYQSGMGLDQPAIHAAQASLRRRAAGDDANRLHDEESACCIRAVAYRQMAAAAARLRLSA